MEGAAWGGAGAAQVICAAGRPPRQRAPGGGGPEQTANNRGGDRSNRVTRNPALFLSALPPLVCNATCNGLCAGRRESPGGACTAAEAAAVAQQRKDTQGEDAGHAGAS